MQVFQSITNYKTNHVTLDSEPNLPAELNNFYCRFDTKVDPQPCSLGQCIRVCCSTIFNREHEVRNLHKQNSRKAAGPDLLSSASLKCCVYELATILTEIFNGSHAQQRVQACFKSDVIVPVPYKSNPSCVNDYRPVGQPYNPECLSITD